MNITDLNGKEIIVTDLPIAIMQADDYRHYRVSHPAEHDLYLYKYWKDVYQKLLLLDTEINSDN
ncbi:hypothetical protein KXD93_06940 [Mucilaginibacter sp. BJC16-A38]|uniref:hypothetical protein n=1 Tax=Mucilaginibacter phenanthrenivorans TaxID=1234842 RepID=UPI0021582255|nr:hypothetical protein [Mucilaginibacter phenanthrenivorans]MCR8557370.1 hypothetical protein [Mucilaginibacter phenanthrenivorans]